MRTPISAFVTLTVLSVSSLVGLASAPAHAACQRQPEPGGQISATPWHLQLMNLGTLPAGLTGKGVKVAVLDSGVDAANPALQGQLDGNRDFLHGVSTPEDCFGHGTAVAGIIAGLDKKGTNFRGIAPGAKIISARVSENTQNNEAPPPALGDNMAEAVKWAISQNAQVINMSFTYESEVGLDKFKAAVAEAISKGIVVVAAAGNNNKKGNKTPYPAAWPKVLGVGAIRADGFIKMDESQQGPYVDIAAPGVGVWAPRPINGFSVDNNGTSFAAPIVAAAAALVFEAFPGISGEQVVARLLATADPAPGGRKSDGYGVGIVNPVRAVSDILDFAPPQAAKPLPIDPNMAQKQAAADRQAKRESQAIWISGIVLLGVVLAVALMAALPAGSRRRWRPAGR